MQNVLNQVHAIHGMQQGEHVPDATDLRKMGRWANAMKRSRQPRQTKWQVKMAADGDSWCFGSSTAKVVPLEATAKAARSQHLLQTTQDIFEWRDGGFAQHSLHSLKELSAELNNELGLEDGTPPLITARDIRKLDPAYNFRGTRPMLVVRGGAILVRTSEARTHSDPLEPTCESHPQQLAHPCD
mmetsp:Transcript_51399/g.115421  ORF Transcript_51399/g.115421 Transcript_51399/m.115421 type:complete len:185 (-) Transcript_51399:1395-1949(-)